MVFFLKKFKKRPSSGPHGRGSDAEKGNPVEYTNANIS